MITIDYDLFGTGWARCSIALDGKRIEITGSYLSDCLGGLAGAAVQLLGGAISVRTAFDEEPGEYRWIIDAKDGRVRVRILLFPDLWGDKPDADGEVLLDGCCGLTEFVTAVREMLQRVLEAHGVEGYKALWVEHEFPSGLLRALCDAT